LIPHHSEAFVITMQALDFDAKVYLTVTLSSTLPYQFDPSLLSAVHPDIEYICQVGELQDVQLIGVPKQTWDYRRDEIIRSLETAEGVIKIDVQGLKQRTKRDEF
jgi:hypothetical protein